MPKRTSSSSSPLTIPALTMLLFILSSSFFIQLLSCQQAPTKTTTTTTDKNHLVTSSNNNNKITRRILICTPSLPGHYYPLAILAKTLLESNPQNEITFVMQKPFVEAEEFLSNLKSEPRFQYFYLNDSSIPIKTKEDYYQYMVDLNDNKEIASDVLKTITNIFPIITKQDVQMIQLLNITNPKRPSLSFNYTSKVNNEQFKEEEDTTVISNKIDNRKDNVSNDKYVSKKEEDNHLSKKQFEFRKKSYDLVIADSSLMLFLGHIADHHVPCLSYSSNFIFGHSPLHYPLGIMFHSKMEITNLFNRFIYPYVIFYELSGFLLPFYKLFGQLPSGSDAKNCIRISSASLGLEYSSPQIQQLNTYLVGPFINMTKAKEERNLMLNYKNIDNKIDDLNKIVEKKKEIEEMKKWKEIGEWMDEQENVILGIFGSTAVLHKEYIEKLLNGIIYSLEKHDNISYLLFLREINYNTLQKLLKEDLKHINLNNLKIKIINGHAPQLGILSHEKVKIFITHCGAGSIYEALYFGKLIIGMPFAFDHFKNSLMVVESGVGFRLYSSPKERVYGNWPVEKLEEYVNLLLTDSKYQEKANKIQTLMKYSGGINRAVEIIEMAADLKGDLFYTEIDSHLSTLQWYYLDVIIMYILTMCLIIFIVRKSIAYCKAFKRKREQYKLD
ncbi:hypothetical protein ABK040_008986 [Willaertia magna]